MSLMVDALKQMDLDRPGGMTVGLALMLFGGRLMNTMSEHASSMIVWGGQHVAVSVAEATTAAAVYRSGEIVFLIVAGLIAAGLVDKWSDKQDQSE